MSDSQLKAPKGTRDLFGQEGTLFSHLESVARMVFSQYQFSEVRTPIFESLELFSRSLGDTSDVVQKEMFSFSDRGERHFALRPEGTAGVVRFFIEQKLFVKGGIHRLFYMGPMFRAERPQAGRYRQFWQIGSEHFGDASASAEADTVLMAGKILEEFGIKDFSIHVNSLGSSECRSQYREALLAYLKKNTSILSQESLDRMEKNPLRVLDSKVDGPKLKDPPKLMDYLSKDSKDHYDQFLSLVKKGPYQIEENPRLVRGLDYYTQTVFEFVSPELGAQNALAAGGRYDGLVEELGGPSTPAVGFALGMDRVVSVLQKMSDNKQISANWPLAIVAPLVERALEPAFACAHQLRNSGFAVPPVMVRKKLKNILGMAVEIGAKWAILIGEDELARKMATVKDLAKRTQETVAIKKVADYLKS